MPVLWRKAFVFLVCLAVIALDGAIGAHVQRAAGQTEPPPPAYPQAQLYPLDKQYFPLIRSFLDAFDSGGSFVRDLQLPEVTVMENGQALAAQELAETAPGVQFVLALTFGPAMGIRDGLGRSRYDYLQEGLAAWESNPTLEPPDDLSLVLDNGPETIHVTSSDQILETLQRFEADPRQAIPSLQPLSRAIDVALDPTDRLGMKRAVLFITPPQETEAIAGLQSLSSQAVQAGIRIFIWQVSATQEVETPSTRQLELMAAQTGGAFFNYTGAEAIPNIEAILEPLRFTYQLSYRSAITSSGTYSVTVELQHDDLAIVTSPQRLELTLQPPNPVFIALPSQIERQPAEEEAPSEAELAEKITPSPVVLVQEQMLEVLVEFPDGYPRELTGSALIVDGMVVDRKSAVPFDTFTWDLTPYTTSGQHLVQAVVTDTLGLRGDSLALPVEVITGEAAFSLASEIRGRGLWLIGLIGLFFGGVVGLVLILGGWLRPYRFRRAIVRRASDSRRAEIPANAASGTMESAAESARPGWLRRMARPQSHSGQQARAFLVPISESDIPTDEAPMPIGAHEVILGSDPSQTTWVVSDLAIDPVHTRLRMESEQTLIFDEGTVAGTWVNYRRVPQQGYRLRHGDLIHIGCRPYRFKSRDPRDMRKPVILSQERSS